MSFFRRVLSFLVPYVFIDNYYRKGLMPHHNYDKHYLEGASQWAKFETNGSNLNYFRLRPHARDKRTLIIAPGNMGSVYNILSWSQGITQFDNTHNLCGMDYRYTESNALVDHQFSDQTVREHVADVKAFIRHLRDTGVPYPMMDIHSESFGSQAAIWAVYELIQESLQEPQPLADEDNPAKITVISRNGFADLSDYHPLLNQKNVVDGLREAGLAPPIDLVDMAQAIPNLYIVSTDGDLIVPEKINLRRKVEAADTQGKMLGATFRTKMSKVVSQVAVMSQGPHNCDLTEAALPGINDISLAIEDKCWDKIERAILLKDDTELALIVQQLMSNVQQLLETLPAGPDRDRCLPNDTLDPVAAFRVTRDKAFCKRHPELNITLIQDQCYSLIKLQSMADKIQGKENTYAISQSELAIAESEYPMKPIFLVRLLLNPWIQGAVLLPIMLFAGIGKIFGLLGDGFCSFILRQNAWGKSFNKFCDTIGTGIGAVIGVLIALLVVPCFYLKTKAADKIEAIANAMQTTKKQDAYQSIADDRPEEAVPLVAAFPHSLLQSDEHAIGVASGSTITHRQSAKLGKFFGEQPRPLPPLAPAAQTAATRAATAADPTSGPINQPGAK